MNKIILMGRLTSEPTLRYTNANNTAVASFTLAVPRRKKDEADFISCIAWDKNAEFCSKHFIKGQQVAVVGRIQTRTWDDNEGKKHYVTEVVVEENYFADSKKAQQQEQYSPVETEDELPF